MNNSHIATAVIIRDLNCYCIDTISDRILLQKKVYLAQDLGLPLGYGYGWYIHGPYSTDLTDVVYQIVPEGAAQIEKCVLKEPYSTMISKVNALSEIIEKEDLHLSIVQWYELIASIAYWYKNGFDSEENILKKLKETKPQFSDEQVHRGYTAYISLKKVG